MTTLATKTGPKQLGGVPRWSLAVSGPHTALASGQTIPAVAAEVPIGFAEVPIGAAEGPIGSAVDTVTAELGRAEEGTADKRTDTPEEGPVQRRQHRDYRAVMAQRPDLLGAVTAGMTGEVAADKRADTPEEAPLRRRQQRDYRAMMARRSDRKQGDAECCRVSRSGPAHMLGGRRQDSHFLDPELTSSSCCSSPCTPAPFPLFVSGVLRCCACCPSNRSAPLQTQQQVKLHTQNHTTGCFSPPAYHPERGAMRHWIRKNHQRTQITSSATCCEAWPPAAGHTL